MLLTYSSCTLARLAKILDCREDRKLLCRSLNQKLVTRIASLDMGTYSETRFPRPAKNPEGRDVIVLLLKSLQSRKRQDKDRDEQQP